ncbi:MAG: GxxExxY protein [Cyclobacteriaceae bacterium]|nr:GxxExxY protein [Cyclobacteriaceae bacterium]
MEKDELTYKIIGCAMKVHTKLGPGFQEVIYQRCLAIELERAGLIFARELEQEIFYDGISVGTRRADFVIENKVVVELKALVSLEDVHLAQAKNYVVAYDFPLGLLINFGSQSLQHKLLFNPKYHPKPNSVNSTIQ